EQAVECSLARIVDGFDVGHAPVAVHGQVCYMARSAADDVEDVTSQSGSGILAGVGWLEIVEQIECQVVDNRRINLVSVLRIWRRRRTDLILRAVEDHSRWRRHARARAGCKDVGIG